jgi:hypothetical protein
MIEIRSINKNFIPRNIITCACGCGEIMEDRDFQGRIRRFVSGHNSKTLESRKIFTKRVKGRVSSFKGKHHSDSSKKLLHLANIGKKMSIESITKKVNKVKGMHYRHHYISEERKLKTRLSHKGKHPSVESNLKRSLTLKKTWEDVEKRKMNSLRMKQLWANTQYREKMCSIRLETAARGERAGSWKGGVSFIPYTKDFNNHKKRYIRTRDNHVCQLCGKTKTENGKNLSVHHIDYNKSNCHETNLITLCITCNIRVNHHRDHWTSYFKRLLNNKYALVLVG